MRVLVIGSLTYVAFVLRTVLPLGGTWGAWAPRIDLALLLWIVCRSGGTTGLLTAAGWGLISDALSHGALGIDVLSFVLVAYAVQMIAAKGGMHSPLTCGLVAGSAVVVTLLASTFLRFSADQPGPQPFNLMLTVGGPSVSTAVLVFAVCEGWFSIVGRSSSGPRSMSPQVANRWHMLTE